MSSYTFFLAHAGADTERAKELYSHLHPYVSVFLDAMTLTPGDAWDTELAYCQGESLATVALVSAAANAAYYLREEIASAIAYQRHDPGSHRLIPVYLDGIPADPYKIPYGLRALHSLDAVQLGLAGVAAKLKRMAATLGAASLPSPHIPSLQPFDRFGAYDALCRLLPAQFEVVLFRARAPTHELAPATQPLAVRALDLVQWAENESIVGLDNLATTIRRVAPGVLP